MQLADFLVLSNCAFSQAHTFGYCQCTSLDRSRSNTVWLSLQFYLEIVFTFYYAISKEELCYNVQFAVRQNPGLILLFRKSSTATHLWFQQLYDLLLEIWYEDSLKEQPSSHQISPEKKAGKILVTFTKTIATWLNNSQH